MNSVYGRNTVRDNHVQVWFRRFHSGNCLVIDASRSGGPNVENIYIVLALF